MDKDPLYNQYLYQEVDDYDDEEEEMEIDDWMLADAGDACVAASTGTRCLYRRLPAIMPPTQNRLQVHPGVSIWILIQQWSLIP